MESATVQPWALLLDPNAAQAAVEHISSLKLQRRICRPLDHRRKLVTDPALMQFDAAVDAEALIEEGLSESEPAPAGL